MNVYAITMQVAATAYIKAASEEEAMKKAKHLELCELELPTRFLGDVEVNGLEFNNPNLPEVSLSPVMTVHGPWREDSGDVEVECVYEGAEGRANG